MVDPRMMDLTAGRPASQGGAEAHPRPPGTGYEPPHSQAAHRDRQQEVTHLTNQVTAMEGDLARKRHRLAELHAGQ